MWYWTTMSTHEIQVSSHYSIATPQFGKRNHLDSFALSPFVNQPAYDWDKSLSICSGFPKLFDIIQLTGPFGYVWFFGHSFFWTCNILSYPTFISLNSWWKFLPAVNSKSLILWRPDFRLVFLIFTNNATPEICPLYPTLYPAENIPLAPPQPLHGTLK